MKGKFILQWLHDRKAVDHSCNTKSSVKPLIVYSTPWFFYGLMRNYVSPVLDRPLHSACPHTRHQSSHLILGQRESSSNSDEVHNTGSWAAGAGGYFQAVVPVQSPAASLLFLPAHISELHCNQPRGSMRAEWNSWAAADRYNFIGKIKSLQKSTLTIWHGLSALRSLNYLECYFQFWEPNDRRGACSTGVVGCRFNECVCSQCPSTTSDHWLWNTVCSLFTDQRLCEQLCRLWGRKKNHFATSRDFCICSYLK